MVMNTRLRPPGRSHLRHQSDPGDGWFFSHAEPFSGVAFTCDSTIPSRNHCVQAGHHLRNT